MRKTKEFVIGGQRYQSAQLGAVEGRRLHLRFAKMMVKVLPALVALKGTVAKAGNIDSDPTDSDETKLLKLVDRVSEDEVFGLIGDAISSLNEEDVELFWKAFMPLTFVITPGGRMVLDAEFFDQHFAGRYMEMSKLFIELVGFNFGGFLAGLGASGEVAAASPTAS